MSINSWIEEFYPELPSIEKPEIEHLKHCLIKWKGATKENTNKHEVVFTETVIRDLHTPLLYINFDNESCALCILHNEACKKCCITKVTGYSCLKTYDLSWNDPTPMITLLETVLKEMENAH